MKSTYDYDRIIKANDRATMLNLMNGLDAYTLCSGIICEELNGDDSLAIPLKESGENADWLYSSCRIGSECTW